MDKKPLPKKLAETAQSLGIAEGQVIAFACPDMNKDCAFVKSYLLLTKDMLVIIDGKVDPGNVFVSESLGEAPGETTDVSEHEIRKIPLEDLDALKLSAQIRTGLMYCEGRTTEVLSYFTIARYGEMLQLAAAFTQLKNPKAGTETEGEGRRRRRRPDAAARRPMEDALEETAETEKKMRPREHLPVSLRLFSYLKPHRFRLALVFLCYIAVAACNLVWPYLSGTVLYDQIMSRDPGILKTLHIQGNRFILALGLVVLGMAAAKFLIMVISILQNLLNAVISNHVIMTLRNDVFASMGELELRYFQNAQTGTLMVRVLQDANIVSRLIVDEMPGCIINIFTLVSTVAIMFSLDVKLAFASLLLLPLTVFMSAKIRPRLHVLFGKRHRAERRLNTALNDNITGARVVKVFGKEPEEIQKFENTNQKVQDAEVDITKFSGLFNASYSFVEEMSTLFIWAIGAYLVLRTEYISYGLLLTFIGYVAQMNRPIQDLVRIFRQWVDSMNAAERLFEIIDAQPQITDAPDALDLDHARGEIELKNVYFGYEPNIPVFEDFSFKVPAGSMLGIVGRSGAGKTTLVNIISRMYEVNKGSIRIDGVDIRDISLKSLRKNIAMVSQETYIFIGTIAENIAYAKPEATREEIIAAAKLASAHDFICKLPDGYDTVIGASGRNLSGGERQRLSIARAVLADPKILILDEATASVDTETERAIQTSLAALSKNRTTLSIAHRLSTLRDADYLIVLEHGKITEQGTHEELMRLNGTYCMLKELQTNALALKGLE